ncbi:MAG: exodeoxyribonuclease V subunit gamma, partial [Firmicutes bacterium]|nr:exodeoxyribonuclease V subunit gamma [Bacillota bacterium]
MEVESLLFSGTGKKTESCRAIKIIQAPGEYLEVEMIAREIVKLVHSGHYNFPDIAVVFRDAGIYPARIRDIFARFSIPFQILHPEPLVSASLTRSLIALINLFDEGWRREDVFTLLHSPVLGVDSALGGRIEIEARICGIFSERREWLRDWGYSV